MTRVNHLIVSHLLSQKVILTLVLICAQLALFGQQRISVTLNGGNVNNLFDIIQRQTDYQFIYSNDDLAEIAPINLRLADASVEEVLKEGFKNSPLSYKVKNKTIIISRGAKQKQIMVSGTVKDAQGAPLEGVSVRIKNTNLATSTSSGGTFSITVEGERATVMFSSVGFASTERSFTETAKIAIVLQSVSAELEEVVIAYGVVKRGDLTGSVSSIRKEAIASAAVSRVDQALQGKAAGVYVTAVNGAPGAGTTIRIRGGNSISASNEPLYVIDGFIGTENLISINPADIESIEVLKDASATALYGARGANGVILVTTKRGTTGRSNITLDTYAGMQELPREIALLDGPQLAAFVNERAALYNAAPIFDDLSQVTTTNWQKAVTNRASMNNVNLAFDGGSDKLTYFVSGNYFDQDGIIRNSGFRRYQARVNLEFKPYEWLRIGSLINLSRTNTSNNKVDLYDVLKSAPVTSPVFDGTGGYTIISNLNGGVFENPLARTELMSNNTFDNNLNGNWYANAALGGGFSIKAAFGVSNRDSKNATYTPGALPLRSTRNVGGYASISDGRTFNFLNENTLNYLKGWGKHHLDAIGGFTYQHESTETFGATGEGFSNDLLKHHNLSTGNPQLARNSSGFSEWTMISFLARANYTFNDRYLFTVSARQDGSSRLSANHKWAFFPSFAAAWKMKEEDFLRDVNWLDELKLRFTYGKTGNQAVGVYSTLSSLNVSNAYFNGVQHTGYVLGNIPNDDLKWETTDQYDAGIDAGFLDNRLSVNLDFYHKKTYDLLLTVQIPGTTGYSSRLQNIGIVQNKGVELNVQGTLVDKTDFRWELGANIAMNRNRILDIGTSLGYRELADGARLIVGQPAPVFYGGVYQGTYKTQAEIDALPTQVTGLMPGFPKFKDNNGNHRFDGVPDYEIIGNPEPDFFGGFNTDIRYKRLSLSAFFQYSYGNDIINTFAPRLFMGEYASNVGAQAVDRWTLDNQTSNLPRVGSYTLYSVNTQAYSFAVQDGSFLRLKTLQLNYQLKSDNINWLNQANIFLTGSNLFLWTDYNWGYDPEVNSNGTHAVIRGFDGYNYPQNRSIVLGLNVKL